MGCHALLQGVFPTQGSNPCLLQLLHCRRILYGWDTREARHRYLFGSVTQLCLTLCNPMDCSTPGFLVHHQHPELTQTHVHWVSDATISFPVVPSAPAFNLSQHQGLFQGVSSSATIRWPNYWSFSFSISPSNDYSGLISFRMDWLDLPAVQGNLKSHLPCGTVYNIMYSKLCREQELNDVRLITTLLSSPTPQFKSINFLVLSFVN